jgi:two-component system, OmpR family, response regulator CpxR
MRTVLLVEDDLDVRDVLQDLLEDRGYDVIPAENGKQALEYLCLDSARPDVVILDLMMPLVTGWQVLETMRADPRLARVPVVVLTAVTRDRPSGATAVVKKPFHMEDLFTTLERCVMPRQVAV